MAFWTKWFSKPAPAPEPAKPKQTEMPKVHWLDAGSPGNPFPFAVLDLMFTQGLLSTSADPAVATRSVSWSTSIGDELDISGLLSLPEIPASIRLPVASSFPPGLIFTPRAMEQKWVIAWRPPHVIFARSWTGSVEAIGSTRIEDGSLIIDSLRVRPDSVLQPLGELPAIVEWMLRSHALGQRIPLPVSDGGAAMLEQVPVVAFSTFGSVVFCAARTWKPPPAPKPLRSDGRLVVLARQRDHEGLKKAVADGDDVNAPATFAGYTPLHLAIVNGDTALLKHLLALGADVNHRADRGMFSLAFAVVHAAPPELFEELLAAGVELQAANDDGFNALHAAGETGNTWAVRWLHEHGLELEARTRRNNTPLQIACALGHLDAAKALVALGADVTASSPEGTALDIARREGRPEVAAWLESLAK